MPALLFVSLLPLTDTFGIQWLVGAVEHMLHLPSEANGRLWMPEHIRLQVTPVEHSYLVVEAARQEAAAVGLLAAAPESPWLRTAAQSLLARAATRVLKHGAARRQGAASRLSCSSGLQLQLMDNKLLVSPGQADGMQSEAEVQVAEVAEVASSTVRCLSWIRCFLYRALKVLYHTSGQRKRIRQEAEVEATDAASKIVNRLYGIPCSLCCGLQFVPAHTTSRSLHLQTPDA